MPAIPLASLPDLAAIRAANRRVFPLLLQSAGESGWDLLFYCPQSPGLWPAQQAAQFWPAFEQAWRDNNRPPVDSSAAGLPFHGGWVYFLGYELLHVLEPSVAARDWRDDFPLAALARSPAALLIDRQRQQAWAFGETGELLAQMQAFAAALPRQMPDVALQPEALLEDEAETFLAGVERIKAYIYEGDVFQVNLSRGWQVQLAPGIDADAVYASLRRANPAPFSGLFDMGDCQIVSSSPERLLQVRDGHALTRPIAGTHPRSTDPDEDAQLKARLVASTKERAEHVMLIDLERNDLGRICRPGTVRVDELMAVASYSYVHHIESTVSGDLRSDVSPVEALRAMFPGGTITGCPKVRTMQIIAELETASRRAYTGSIGYLNHDGSLDSNILIRSFMQQGANLRFRAGAGIVADSDPQRELQETRAKARGLLRALGVQA